MSTNDRDPESRRDEADLLEQEAQYARIALRRAMKDLKASLAKGVDVRLWAKEHPLAMAGIAAAVGFVAAEAAVPSKRQQELKRWIAIERAAAAVRGDGGDKPAGPPKPGFLSVLGREAITALRPALIGLATSAVSAYEQNREDSMEAEEMDPGPDIEPPPINSD